MKHSKRLILLSLLFVLFPRSIVFAVDCTPSFSGNRTVEQNCRFASSAAISGDIIVGPYTVTVPSGVKIGINLATNKITFTTGKMLFEGTASAGGGIAFPYKMAMSFTHNAPITSCPSGAQVLNSGGTAFVTFESLTTESGTMWCAYP